MEEKRMKRFTNRNIQKEKKKMIKNIIIGVILLVVAAGCHYWEKQMIKKANDNMVDLNSIIISSNEKEDKKAYINAQSQPYKFAVYDDTTDSYYIIADDKYLYIVYMSTADYLRLNHDSIYDEPIRIEGITKTTTEDVKKLAIDAYNEGRENTDEQITLSDFNDYFGSVYLNMTVNDSTIAWLPFSLFFLFIMLGGIVFLIGMIELIRFSRSIKKLDDTKIDELDHEMNDQNAFFYDRARLYLTKNYIINFAGTFKPICYQDILWMYPFEQRTNGIKTSQSIKILTKDGITYTIATLDVITKKKKEVYDEIWNTIVSKNEQIKTGYTKENIKEMNQKIKKIKKARKK